MNVCRILFSLFLGTCFFSPVSAYTPALSELPLRDSVTVHGITWKFSQAVRVGQFVNKDYYVVGAVTVSAITPAPTVSPARNGTVLNIPPADQGTAFDDRSANYRASWRKYPPITMQPGDALVSTVSIADSLRTTIRAWLSTGNGTESICRTAAVLTCVAAPVPTDAFRPAYCDRGQKIYCADSIRWNLLPNLRTVASMTPAALSEWSRHFYQSPWLDACFFGFDAPLDYMPHYSAETGRAVGIASLFLECDFTRAQKDSLMTGLLQYAIDLWGIVRGCNASRGWQAHGGHGTGRKWPMMFAGLMLGDTAMAKPTRTYPNLRIGEDMQTMYDNGWTGATVVYAGHQGVWNGVPVSTQPGWGPYEHTTPDQWYCCEPGYTAPLGEAYRRCCTSHAWIGEALGAWIMHAESLWNHPAFFDYVDRWMTEDDSAAVARIRAARGWDFSADWERQGQAWDGIVNEMWAAYRHNLPVIANEARGGTTSFLDLTLAPNPFRTILSINFLLPAASHVQMNLYNLRGEKLAAMTDRTMAAGWHRVLFDARGRAPGIYLLRIETSGGYGETKKLMLLK